MRQGDGIRHATGAALGLMGTLMAGMTMLGSPAHAAATGETCLAIVERLDRATADETVGVRGLGGATQNLRPGTSAGQAFDMALKRAPQSEAAPSIAPVPAPSRALAPTQSPTGPDVEHDRFQEVPLHGVTRVADQPVSTFAADVDTASMGVVRRFIRDGDLPPSNAVRVEEMVNYFDYAYPRPATAAEPFAPSVSVMPSPWGAGREVMVIGIRGWSPERSVPRPANIVLLADVSGSMHGPNRLGLVKQSMALLVDQLDGDDFITLVTYAGADQVVLEPTPASDKDTICTALGRLTSGGGTAGSKGIATAYDRAEQNFRRGAINRIILATDGDFNLGVVEDGRLEDYVARKRETGIYLSILGVGRGNYNDQTMQRLAQAGNGMAAYLDSLEEGRRVLVEKLAAQLQPIADDVKVQVEFNPARVAEHRLVGYETRILREEDFANDAVDAGEIGDGHTVTAIYEIAAPGSAGLRLPERRYGNDAAVAPAGGRDAEIAHLRIRWKAPGETASRLMERPVTDDDRAPLAQQSDDARFAVAVAGFAQILQDNTAIGDYGLGDVAELASGALGDDPNGHRARFVALVRDAMSLN
ncbi:VWA domain-containing protein [Roseospira marina]|uniref:VWA domain-containing protein n=1 Tax=Roseospira marina TaxID=140057 RepID=A0A5M6IBF0_9PROT|nr:VWA domain-containing protein [Roseospira marina]KAA5605576.1 VWA domain-containing protein [Roseospira marina]MBB4313360.1 Ca-activated chloride channel family protein [Roseospira marina]MBB5085899.1 Ca-activated chloride channel family protein [Roseospira marina]